VGCIAAATGWLQGVPAPKKSPHERIERLNHWLDKGQNILPWLVRFMKL